MSKCKPVKGIENLQLFEISPFIIVRIKFLHMTEQYERLEELRKSSRLNGSYINYVPYHGWTLFDAFGHAVFEIGVRNIKQQ